MPKTTNKKNQVTVVGRVSFRNVANAKGGWVQRELTPEQVKAEVAKRIAEEFPHYKQLAAETADAVVKLHAELWGYNDPVHGKELDHYSGVLMFIGSPKGMQAVNEVGLKLELVRRQAFKKRRGLRKAKLKALVEGNVVPLHERRKAA